MKDLSEAMEHKCLNLSLSVKSFKIPHSLICDWVLYVFSQSF